MYFKLFKQAREFIQKGDIETTESILAEIAQSNLPPKALHLFDALQQRLTVLLKQTKTIHTEPTNPLALLDSPNAFYGKGHGGWSKVVEKLRAELGPKDDSKQTVGLVSHMERYFLWDTSDSIAIIKPWVGIVHNPLDIPEWYQTSLTNQNLFKTPLWLESRDACVGLITFSEVHKKQLSEFLGSALPVHVLSPPILKNEVLWSYEKYVKNTNKKLIQTGFFLQNLHALKEFPPLEDIIKYQIRFSDMPYFKNKQSLCQQYSEAVNITYDFDNNIKEVGFLGSKYYQAWLNENIVLFDFCAFSYSTTFYDCIAKTVPILVNRLPEIEFILGVGYPLFYEAKSDIPALLKNTEKLRQAQKQLHGLATSHLYSVDQYVEKLITLPLLDNQKTQRNYKVTVVTVVSNSFKESKEGILPVN